MKAAVFHGPGDVRVEQVPHPGEPGDGEVLIEVIYAGLCGTDAAEYRHGPTTIPWDRPHPASGHHGPVVLGHEFVGRVTAVGAGVDPGLLGHRVVPGAGVYCGHCSWCRAGRPNLCATYYTLGLQADGGLAESVIAPAGICHVVPDGCPDERAAMAQPLAVALHALDRAELAADDTLVVFGAGGIGGFLVAGASARGVGRIVAVDLNPAQLVAAEQLGATTTVRAGTSDPVAAILELTGGEGAAVVAEASGAPGVLAQALAVTRRGGRTVLVGIPKSAPTIDTAAVTLREVSLIGTVAHIADRNLPEALAILAVTPGLDRAIDRIVDVDDIQDGGLEPLAAGGVNGKVLVRPSG